LQRWIGRPVYLDYESVTSRFPADITTDIFSLSNRSKAFYKKYLQLPSTLPERVRTLAQELTKDAKTDYEKAKVIEQYLKNNYTYTLTPGDVPKGYDFVDYFLFESKEGYCTYYATAMTILLRCVGVPARYVEGFLVTEENYQGGGRFDVLGSNAHAWPEVYLEGIGFVEFEPTASFNGPNPVEIPDASSTPELTPEPTPEPTVEETPSEEPTDAPETTTPKPSPIPDENDNDDLVPVISEAFIKFLKLMLVILAVIALFASVMVLRVKWFFGKITKMDSRSYVIYVFKRMEKVIGRYYVKRNPSFTLPEYEHLLENSGFFEAEGMREVYKRAALLFNKARYSRDSIDKQDAKAMLDTYNDFANIERNRIGSMKFFARRYILGTI
jgi:transglutaminase-like putative cysteine protease